MAESIKLKTVEEIAIMQEGGHKHAEILRALVKMLEPGVSTLTLENEALRLIKEQGGKPAFLGYQPKSADRPYPAALCVSINDEIVHGVPNENIRVIEDGDIVSIDLGFIYKGLITDSAVSVVVGAGDDEARRLVAAGEAALKAGIAAALPGNHVGDIGAAIAEVAAESGLALAEDLAGHGVGHAVHELPFVPNTGNSGEGEDLVPGLVIAIEPMLTTGSGAIKTDRDGYTIRTKDGSRAVHSEHTVAITETGHIILTL